MAVGAGRGGAVLMIVAEKMTAKTFGQRASKSGVTTFRLREDTSRGREDSGAIGELNVLCCVSRDRKGMVFFVSVAVIRGGRVYCSGGRGSH